MLGIGVNAPKEAQEEKVFKLASDLSDFMGSPNLVSRDDVVANCDYVGDQFSYEARRIHYDKIKKKAIYGTMNAALLAYKKLARLLNEIGMEMNPYDPCVVNCMVNGKQQTVTWHIDDLNISHKD